MANLTKLGLARPNRIINQGLVKYKGLVKVVETFASWYQWLKLGLEDDVTNSGNGGPDGIIISGTMAGQDLVIDWTNGDAGLIALAVAYGIPYPEITYAEMKVLPQNLPINLEKTINSIDSIIISTDQKLLESVPIEIDDEWFLPDETGDNNVKMYSSFANLNSTQYATLKLDTDYSFEIGHTIKIVTNFYGIASSQYFFTKQTDGSGIRYNGSTFLVYNQAGATDGQLSYTAVDEVVELSITRNNSTEYEFYINEISIGIATQSSGATLIINQLFRLYTLFANYYTKPVYMVELNGSAIYFTQGQGDSIVGDGISGTLTDMAPSAFWGFSEKSIPYVQQLGATLYKNNTNNSIMPIIGNNDYTILGFTRDEYIDSQLVNTTYDTYKWPENFNLSQIQQLQDANIYSYKLNEAKVYRRWDYATEYTVNASGTGDYSTLKEALEDQNGYDYVIIHLPPGAYNELNLEGVNNVWIKGAGKDLVTIISDGTTSALPINDKHGFRVEQNMLITGITNIVNDAKYCVHQDHSGIYESYFIDCDFSSPANVSTIIGIGGWYKQNQNYVRCTFNYTGAFISETFTMVYWHNLATQPYPSQLLLQDCTAKYGNLLFAQDLGSGQIDLITIVSCIVDDPTKGLRLSSTSYDLWVLAINTTLVFDNNSNPDLKELNLDTDKNIYGDTDNFVEGSPYTGATPQLVGFTEIASIKPNGSDFQLNNSDVIKDWAAQPYDGDGNLKEELL